jgi:predicted dehydrogenase
MNNLIRVGLAGLGRSGWGMHAHALAQLPALYKVVAVTDPQAARRQEAQERFGCTVMETLGELTADPQPELIVIATPSQLHCQHTSQALQAGKHVIVEKPMAVNLSEVDEMIRMAEANGRLLTINQNYRYHPDYLKVREVINSGKLGQILQVRLSVHQFSRRWDWQTLREYNGGILTNHGAHMIDWAMQMIDDDEPELFCHKQSTPLYAGDADSHTKLILRARSGLLIDIELTHANAYAQDRWLVMGTQGSLAGSASQLRWQYFEPEAAPLLVLDRAPTPDRSYNREELPWIKESCDLSAIQTDGLVALYRELYGTIRHGEPLAITPASVRRQMAILERCQQSGGG